MLLYLLRHAEAVDQASTDAARELTEKGRNQAVKVGKFCARHDLMPELVLTSPLRRAEQTARLAAAEIGAAHVKTVPFLASGMKAESAVGELKSYEAQSLMIVGHEPDFSTLAAFLLGLRSGGNIHLRKASLTILTVESFVAGGAVLEACLPVRFMS